jgi:type IV pilus assembly protein PilY1
MVFVGTGEMLSNADLASTQVESMYGLYDAMPNASVIGQSSLVQQVFTGTTVTTVPPSDTTVNAYTVSANLVALPTQMGWYVNFSLNSGERVVTNPILDAGALIMTTNQPAVSNCVTTTNSWLYLLNYMDGGRFPGPMFDANESSSISSSTPNVAGVALGNVFSSGARVAFGTLGGGTANMDIIINQGGKCSTAGCYTTCTAGSVDCTNTGTASSSQQGRKAWWEIR